MLPSGRAGDGVPATAPQSPPTRRELAAHLGGGGAAGDAGVGSLHVDGVPAHLGALQQPLGLVGGRLVTGRQLGGLRHINQQLRCVGFKKTPKLLCLWMNFIIICNITYIYVFV